MPFKERVWHGCGPWLGVSDGTVFTDLNFQNTWETTRGQPGKSDGPFAEAKENVGG